MNLGPAQLDAYGRPILRLEESDFTWLHFGVLAVIGALLWMASRHARDTGDSLAIFEYAPDKARAQRRAAAWLFFGYGVLYGLLAMWMGWGPDGW